MSVAKRVLVAWGLSALAALALAFFRVLSPLGALHAAVVACTVLGFVVVLVTALRLRLVDWLSKAPMNEAAAPPPSEDPLREALRDPDAAMRLARVLTDLVASASERHPSPALDDAARALAAARGNPERHGTFDAGTLEQILDALEQSWTVS